MVIAVIGENCSGKSTLAEEIGKTLGAETVTGKDYLRLAKSESEAEALFRERLNAAVSGDNIIYVISEPEHIGLLPDGAVRILVSADLDTIKERFARRMNGNLPPPVAQMLERKHGMFDGGNYDFCYDGANGNPHDLCEAIEKL
jgi:cytidylate kinase